MSGKESLNCCEWERVKCDDLSGRVIELSLMEHWEWNFPVWYLNASYFLPFEQLRRLDLLGNNIAGCVDNGGFEVLSSSLHNLEVLDLSYNNFNSSIISSVSEISSLKSLYVHGNGMTTSSGHTNGFEGLSKLSNLEVLSLGYNSFDNNILSSLRNLSSLKVLNLAGNLLNGTIYTHELNHLINLTKLDMSDNKIEAFGSLKGGGSVLRLSNLEDLNMGYNLFTNDALHYVSKLSNLKSLYLDGNRFRGSVNIRELEGLTMLEELDLSDNGIETFVGPEGRKTMDSLRVLRLANLNSNRSLVLESFGAFSSLKTLDLASNIFNRTNTLQDLGNLSSVEELFFDGSSLPENFLQNIGSLSSLKILYLRSCGLKGTLPSQGWCELRNLEELDLAQNELGGTIPKCLTNLSSLSHLDLSSNQFTGNISSTPIPNLMSIEFLSIGYNTFQIPISLKPFANHSNLKQFLCENNELIPEPVFESWTPKFQLQVLSLAIFTAKKVHADIPNFLYYQHDLISIDLSGTNFSGGFPSWLFENNTMLNTLSIRDSSFGGLFPWPSRPNPNIIRIDISHNQLQGEIPTNISSIFPNLKDLILSENSFGGNIPPSLGELESMQALDLSKNNFSGGIPVQFLKHHSTILFLKLSHNQFSGQIHPTSFNSSRLEYLQLDNNKFVGKIPDLSFMYSLSLLDLSNNFFSEFPRLTSSLSSLQIIYLSTNNFEGTLSSQICKISSLRVLDVSENKFSGFVPSCFSQFTKIESLHLFKNEFVGPMPSFFTNYTTMVALDLRHNNFSGSIPSWIGRLSNLGVVLLQGNRLGGEIPIELCQLNHLSILDLSLNNLSGRLPPCLGNMTFKTDKELSYVTPDFTSMDVFLPFQVKFSDRYSNAEAKEVIEFTTKDTSLDYTGNILEYMSGVDLSCNQFSGEIPGEFGNLINVRALNLSHNNLVGLIPTRFSNLKQMESLDLSYNKLNGRIPPQLTVLNSLEVFKVAHNNLSGPIPDSKAQFGTFDESSYEGNPYLCGPPLSKSCNKAAANTPKEYDGQEEEDDFMDMTGFYVSFVVSYIIVLLGIAAVLYINPYWWHLWSYKVDLFFSRCY
ncbi:receptor-like protein 14 isoform X1 [Tripterygium wilfordii]|uniref:receptor-like protein 14 isoform X1 n=2 Tax=Tripterygium wilfordii TaxID=458696 RepID=UPI0018F834F9|nr:receptor-like protein 14 isoform X1 [Tripterygium wilfordii]